MAYLLDPTAAAGTVAVTDAAVAADAAAAICSVLLLLLLGSAPASSMTHGYLQLNGAASAACRTLPHLYVVKIPKMQALNPIELITVPRQRVFPLQTAGAAGVN